MGYEIENTLDSFQKAFDVGAGIETDAQLTKDNRIVCLHDAVFKISSIWYHIEHLTFNELQTVPFSDKRKVPLLEDLFLLFKDKSENLRYSCDIGNKKVGFELISLARKLSILEKIEITDLKLNILSALRERDKQVKLIHTIPHHIPKINQKNVNFQKIKELGIEAVNIKFERATHENFKNIIDQGLKCYVWGVNAKSRMKKVLNMNYKDQIVETIYTDYPDILISMRDYIYK